MTVEERAPARPVPGFGARSRLAKLLRRMAGMRAAGFRRRSGPPLHIWLPFCTPMTCVLGYRSKGVRPGACCWCVSRAVLAAVQLLVLLAVRPAAVQVKLPSQNPS
jgi:hypothetical protein